MKLSVLICAYNAQETIARCLDSLLQQAIDLEVIVVNDGSHDHTAQICEDYAARYEFISVIHQVNKGVAETRNTALRQAVGDYITFVDSDDEVVPHAYESVMKKAQEGYDIVVYDALRISDCETYMKCVKAQSGNIQPLDYYVSEPNPWNKIIHRDVWKKSNLWFPSGIIYEDYATIPNLCQAADKIYYLAEPVIKYYLTPTSLTRGNAYKPKAIDILKASEILLQNCESQMQEACEWMFYEHLLQTGCRYFLSFEKYEECKKCADLMNQSFPNFLQNKWVKQRPMKERCIGWLFAKKQFKFVKMMIQIKR